MTECLLEKQRAVKFQLKASDRFISDYHFELYSNNLMAYLLPIDFLVDLPDIKFQCLLNNYTWAQRIFLIMFSNDESIELKKGYVYNAKRLISKVYNSLNLGGGGGGGGDSPFLYVNKIRQVLLYFRNKF